ncbi:MAG: family 1 glycosylhydrolase [Candidatus Omnitrophota bacterium]
MRIQFPSSFLWGAALSSYQTEGNIFNTDWSLWEQEKKLEQAGRACDHYHLFKEDFNLASQLHLNCLRISLEWARICPGPGVYQEEELAHYREVIDTLKALGLKPIITLHHFTNPLWFSQRGGWENSENVDFFLAYLKKTAGCFKKDITYWLILNEPLVYIYNSFVAGIWPPGIRSLKTAKKVLNNLLSAYITGYQEIKHIYRQEGLTAQVSFVKHMRIFSPCPSFSFGLNNLSACVRHYLFNTQFLDKVIRGRYLDFIAINYYCKEYVAFKGLAGVECTHNSHSEKKNALGWYTYACGLYKILVAMKRFKLPIIIMENGTAEVSDISYRQFLLSHLEALGRALQEGVDVRGYLWWSLIDNFEWDKGFGPRFGLISVDYKNLARNVKPFAHTYAGICKENAIDVL